MCVRGIYFDSVSAIFLLELWSDGVVFFCFLFCFITLANFKFIIGHCNKNVGIKFSAHDAFLEYPSSDTLEIERLQGQIIYHILRAI
jgi:hypothetical protein